MMRKNMSLLIFLCTVLLWPKGARAESFFQCELNSNAPGVEIKGADYVKKVKTFQFKIVDGAPGLKTENSDASLFMWAKEGMVHILLKDIKTSAFSKASFLPTQQKINFQLGDLNSLKCSQGTLASSTEIKDTGERFLAVENLKADSDLFSLKTPLKIGVKKSFLVQFEDSTDQMWTAKFQKGVVLTWGQSIDKKMQRCFFTVKPKVQKGVWTPLHETYEVESLSSAKNNSSEMVWSANFVNFKSGTAENDSREYIPFTLECVVFRRPFTLSQFEQITGYALEFLPN